MKRILSIDGGGMKGFIPCAVVAALEKQLGVPAYKYFDLVAGTSIGGIIACLIGQQKSARDSLAFFTVDGPSIFGHQQPGGWQGMLRPRYGASHIESALRRRLGVAKFDQSLPRVLVPAFDLASYEPVFFRSWESSDILTWQVARATSAAQTYFPAFPWRDPMANLDRVLWDGGNAANNPAGIAVAEAMKLWPGEEIAVLSIGCGGSKPAFAAQTMINAGILKVAATTMGLLFEANDDLPHAILSQVLPNYVRIQPDNTGLSIDDASPAAIHKLEIAANKCVEANQDRLQRFAVMAT